MNKLLLTLLSVFLPALTFASGAAFDSLREYGGYAAVQVPEPAAVSAPAALDERKGSRPSVKLSDFRGETYLNFMAAPNGMKAALDKDHKTSFSFADTETVRKAASGFDPAVYKKLLRSLKGGQKGLDELTAELAGKVTTPEHAVADIAKVLEAKGLAAEPEKLGLTAFSAAPVLGLVSGSGVTTVLDGKNFFLN